MQDDDDGPTPKFQPLALDQNRGSALTAGFDRHMACGGHSATGEARPAEPCEGAEKARQGESRRNAALPPRGWHKVVSRFTALSELFASAATARASRALSAHLPWPSSRCTAASIELLIF